MLELNRVYWAYKGGTFMRPEQYKGVHVNVPRYKVYGKNIKVDLHSLSKAFGHVYKDYKFVIAMSGGIDSEITADSFYTNDIPFRAITLDLFNSKNRYDYVYAYQYCKARGIDHKIHKLGLDKFIKDTIPNAVKHGQFTDSLSQVALTDLFNYVADDEILIFSGHNPDFHRQLGWGWWEDSPILVKYAINTKNKFFTFTSLEPIFMHYKRNFNSNMPGDKDNTFIYEQFPDLRVREKRTGWEVLADVQYEYHELLDKPVDYITKEPISVFITWR